MFLMTNLKNIEVKKDVDLKNFCTFKIGGKAKFLYIVKNNTQLIDVCKYLKLHNIKYKIIGLGANLLFDDNGFNGAIIVNKSNKILFKNNSALVDGGVNITGLIMKCCLRSLSGFEALSGIPSTIGGGITNNVGAFNCSIADFVEYVECYSKKNLNKKLILTNADCQFNYRNSIFKSNDYIITKAKLNFKTDNPTLIKQRIMQFVEKKKSTQPLNYPSAGSIFKRGNIIPAKVIDELGLKGTRIGGAEISTKHAGFIVNTNSATSNDVKDLITLIKEKVYKATNEKLELEIELVE